jgi:hypothetical protein
LRQRHFAAALTGCSGSDSEDIIVVPIGSVVATSGGIGVVPDDGRSCPTTSAVQADESEDEIRLTLTSARADGSTPCEAVPVAYLEAPVRARTVVDTVTGRRFTLPADVGGPGASVWIR